MQCPYCNKEMEKGLIQSPQELAWIAGEKKRLFAKSEFYYGSVLLSKLSMLKSSAVVAYLCRDCEKVIIDYSDSKSDYNQR